MWPDGLQWLVDVRGPIPQYHLTYLGKLRHNNKFPTLYFGVYIRKTVSPEPMFTFLERWRRSRFGNIVDRHWNQFIILILNEPVFKYASFVSFRCGVKSDTMWMLFIPLRSIIWLKKLNESSKTWHYRPLSLVAHSDRYLLSWPNMFRSSINTRSTGGISKSQSLLEKASAQLKGERVPKTSAPAQNPQDDDDIGVC